MPPSLTLFFLSSSQQYWSAHSLSGHVALNEHGRRVSVQGAVGSQTLVLG
jgi:hypothetical protein